MFHEKFGRRFAPELAKQVHPDWRTKEADYWKVRDQLLGQYRDRRGIYTFFQRSLPYPAMIVFDAPEGNSACTRRVRSNTPLQALTLLNDQAFMELAQGLAERVLKEAPASDTARIRHAFRLCLAREPSAKEAKRLEQYLALQVEEFRAAQADAQALLGKTGALGKLVSQADLPYRAAWTALARVLLNLDEFITRE